MSDISKLSKRRRKRDRSKTNSDVITTLITTCNKRLLDELNSSNSHGIKRRALSATIGNENQVCSIVIIGNQEGKKEKNQGRFLIFFFSSALRY
jgi:hypothetical protein